MEQNIIPLERIISWTLSQAFNNVLDDEERGMKYLELAEILYGARRAYENETPISNKNAIESSIQLLWKLYDSPKQEEL